MESLVKRRLGEIMRFFRLSFFLIITVALISGCEMLNSTNSDQATLDALREAGSDLSKVHPFEATLDALREAGSDLSKVHPFEFYFYHNEQLGAQHICAELRDIGFQVIVRAGAIEGEWLCLASLGMVPSIDKLNELNSDFNELINRHGGEYDGWETIVIP
jgi:hypothetical protein